LQLIDTLFGLGDGFSLPGGDALFQLADGLVERILSLFDAREPLKYLVPELRGGQSERSHCIVC
jgi:hypothetical protein